MLSPSKHDHPDQTVIAAATTLLKRLRSKRAVRYDELHAHLEKSTRGADFLFIPALSVLFMLGLVEYRPTVDIFEYRGQ
jgi:hypothetical protein